MINADIRKENFDGFEILRVLVENRHKFFFAMRKIYLNKAGQPRSTPPAGGDIRIVRLALTEKGPELKHVTLNGYDDDAYLEMAYPEERILFIDNGGSYFHGEKRTQPAIPWKRDGGPLNGLVSGLRTFDRSPAVICTTGRDLLMRDEDENWNRLGPAPESKYDTYNGFCGFDGFSQDDIYAITPNAGVHHFDGTNWTAISCPIRTASAICCGADGMVYISSSHFLYRGRNNKWDRIHTDQELLYGYKEMVWHDNGVWCTDDLRLDVFRNGKPWYGASDAATPGHLFSRDGVLLTGGLGGKISWCDPSGEWTQLFD